MAKARRDPRRCADVQSCTRCGAEMMLVRIEAAKSGFDLRTFDCSECDNADQYIVEIGTAKSGTLVVRDWPQVQL
jgi:hypothetical protein